MSIQSHVEVSLRFVGDVPGGELVDCVGAVEIRFLVGEVSGWLLLTAVATVTGGGGSGCCWENDRIVCCGGLC